MDTQPWLTAVAEEVGVPVPADLDSLLDLTREVAHRVERKAGPLTLFMLGVAVGEGRSREELSAKVAALLDS